MNDSKVYLSMSEGRYRVIQGGMSISADMHTAGEALAVAKRFGLPVSVSMWDGDAGKWRERPSEHEVSVVSIVDKRPAPAKIKEPREHSYRGWKIGHERTSFTSKKLEWIVYYPEDGGRSGKVFGSLAQAKRYIDDYLGVGEGSQSNRAPDDRYVYEVRVPTKRGYRLEAVHSSLEDDKAESARLQREFGEHFYVTKVKC